MGVDVFGRRLGIGFSVTGSGDFNVKNKLLCNLAEAQNDTDELNLAQVKKFNANQLHQILKTITGMKADLKQEIIDNLKEEIKQSLKGELDVDIKENTANIEYIECMIANGSGNCEKKVYSR